jgi:hypothetical protein
MVPLNKIQLDSNKSHNHQTTEDPTRMVIRIFFYQKLTISQDPLTSMPWEETSYEDTPWNAGSGNTDFSNKAGQLLNQLRV